MFRDLVSRLFHHRQGNVAITFALCIVPIVFLIGMALDYATAVARQQRLNAAADSAALAAVSPSLMSQSTTQAQTVANNVFSAQASAVAGVTFTSPTVSISQNGLARSATVAFTATSANLFPNVLGQTTWPLSGTSTASAATAANIDFYMMLDNSPSMALAATTAGINTMLANTPQQENGAGCAFACHQSNPNSTDTPGNPTGWDNYRLAQSLSVVTRIQNMGTATKALTSSATSLAAQTNTTFRMGVYTFNTSNLGTTLTTVQSLTSNLSQAGTAAAGVDVLEVYTQNNLTSSLYDGDTDTDFGSAINSMNGIMTTPGTGASGSAPKELLFIVTDGVESKQTSTCSQPVITHHGITRCLQPFDISLCSTIKNRGIDIAILYTQYYPLPTDGFYKSFVAPFQSNIGPNLQSCASPGLYFAVSTDDDITSAMSMLFSTAIQAIESHLSN
ncbi:TadE/TadG family type IV pilus assembly protein [Bradyrhizobium sp.]|uniref:TadE/TadG family type IV pilus assembly protein n=1 Tax=Bradyrhizobium sp. TaxID=376 RepID=UPI0025BB883C|nr:pilus assembly protein TadG-related protein [Bradyrhizobium sp.]MBV8922221.1 pilus assembly protein [Bradyrhizobium sp.]